MDIARTRAWKDGCQSLVKHGRHYTLLRTDGNSTVADFIKRPSPRDFKNSPPTPHGERWTARSICSLRSRHAINVYVAGEWRNRSELTVEEAATMLKVTPTPVLKWIRSGRLPATQLCPHAPWVLRQADVEAFQLRRVKIPADSGGTTTQLALKIE